MALLCDVPESVMRDNIINFLSLDDVVTLLQTSRLFVGPARSSRLWDVGLAELSASNTFNLFVAESRLDKPEGGPAGSVLAISAHLLSDPRLDAAAFSALPDAISRFQHLAVFCRATVGHLRDLHDTRSSANWTFLNDYTDSEVAVTARDLHVNKLGDMEANGRGLAFSRYNVMANLIKLNLAQSEMCSTQGPCYWYRQLGDDDCDPFTGSSYRDSLGGYFVGAFIDDGDGNADPALLDVEVGSNEHLEYLTQRPLAGSRCAPQALRSDPDGLFGDKLLRIFSLLEEARFALPHIIEELEAQEEEFGLEDEEDSMFDSET